MCILYIPHGTKVVLCWCLVQPGIDHSIKREHTPTEVEERWVGYERRAQLSKAVRLNQHLARAWRSGIVISILSRTYCALSLDWVMILPGKFSLSPLERNSPSPLTSEASISVSILSRGPFSTIQWTTDSTYTATHCTFLMSTRAVNFTTTIHSTLLHVHVPTMNLYHLHACTVPAAVHLKNLKSDCTSQEPTCTLYMHTYLSWSVGGRGCPAFV